MDKIINLHIEKLPEGVYLATFDDVQGLVAQGRTINETIEIARDVARKIMEMREELADGNTLQSVSETFDYPMIKTSHISNLTSHISYRLSKF